MRRLVFVYMVLAVGVLWTMMSRSEVVGPTLFFAGDSTLDDRGRKADELYASWGTALEKFMVAGSRVDNRAKSGASTKSFIADGHWQRLIADVKPGDWVAIEFGHNDQKRSNDFYREKRWCDPKGAFRDNVRGWVAEIRAKGAKPLLLSPIVRATFDRDGKTLVDREHASDGVCLGSYREAMAELAEELKCDYVDMNGLTRAELEWLGQAEAHKYFFISTGIRKGKDGESSKDTTHPIKAGAEAFARLFLEDVMSRKLPIAALFRQDWKCGY